MSSIPLHSKHTKFKKVPNNVCHIFLRQVLCQVFPAVSKISLDGFLYFNFNFKFFIKVLNNSIQVHVSVIYNVIFNYIKLCT